MYTFINLHSKPFNIHVLSTEILMPARVNGFFIFCGSAWLYIYWLHVIPSHSRYGSMGSLSSRMPPMPIR